MRTPEVTAWWVPAAVRPMFFSQTSDGKTLNGQSYPHPPLVFVVDGEHGLSVRALTENRRPGPRSTIAIAPYWNVNQAGGVCLGSMATPRSAGLPAWASGLRASFKANSRMLETSRSPATTRAISGSGVTWPDGKPSRRNG